MRSKQVDQFRTSSFVNSTLFAVLAVLLSVQASLLVLMAWAMAHSRRIRRSNLGGKLLTFSRRWDPLQALVALMMFSIPTVLVVSLLTATNRPSDWSYFLSIKLLPIWLGFLIVLNFPGAFFIGYRQGPLGVGFYEHGVEFWDRRGKNPFPTFTPWREISAYHWLDGDPPKLIITLRHDIGRPVKLRVYPLNKAEVDAVVCRYVKSNKPPVA